MKITRYISIFLCICVISSLFLIPVSAETQSAEPAQTAPAATVTNGCHTADAMVSLLGTEQIVSNMKSSFVYEMNSDTLLYSWNADAPTEPASFVKIMTALVAIENGDLDEAVTVNAALFTGLPIDAVMIGLKDEEVFSLRDLLYCLLVSSANDAALVISDHISGSQDAFVALMNQNAEKIGCTRTVFKNSTGLWQEGQVTTARDIGKILAYAMKNPDFAEIFCSIYYTISETNKSGKRYLESQNYLMNTRENQIYFNEYVTGGRTAVTNDLQRGLAATSEANGMKIISIVMGCESTFSETGLTLAVGGYRETNALLDACYNKYRYSQILFDGQVISQHKVTNGANDVCLGTHDNVSAVLPINFTLDQLTFQYSDTPDGQQAPIKRGQLISNATIWYGSICLAETELYALNHVSVANEMVDADTEIQFNWWILLLPFVGLIVLFVIVICIIRFVNYRKASKAKKRTKRYQANRRRSRPDV